MSVVKVTAEVGEQSATLSEKSGIFSATMVAPQVSSNVRITALDNEGNSSITDIKLFVNSNWIAPKVDWTPEDFINIQDWNRIAKNMLCTWVMCESCFRSFDIEYFTDEKQYSDTVYASEWNAIENSLEIINENSYNFYIGDTKNFASNDPYIDYIELNRIENWLLRIYSTAKVQYDNQPKMAFRLSNSHGIRP